MSNLRPTFHESWYRVADLKARLRPSAQISRQHYRGERWYVVRDPAGNQYHRLSSAAYRFVGLLDGSRTVSEAWDTAGGVLADDAPTQPEVVQILSQLHAANLLEANITADAGVLLRRHKQMMKKRLQGRLMNVMFPRIPLWDLDKFLVRWMPIMRIALSKFGAVVWLAVIIAGCAALAPEWDRLQKAAANSIQPDNWPWLWATFCVIKLIHELGHAFSCRRFGGEVHELGIMFLVFVPAPYVDASSAWSLPNKWQRMFVGMGGMIFELFVAAVCAFIWKYTDEKSLVSQLAYNTMFIASVSTILFNANPLLRYDGYYILSDWLEIPNLRQKSQEYSLGLIKRHVFRVKSPIPLPPVGQRFWLFIYAIASGIYRVFVGVMIILVVSTQVPVLGILMAIGGMITWLVVPVVKILNYLLLQPELHRKRGRAIIFSGAVAAGIVVLIGMVNFPVRFEAQGYTEPLLKETRRARSAGFVGILKQKDGRTVVEDGVLVKDGEHVVKGQPMVKCYDKQLETTIAKAKADIRAIDAQIAQGLVQDEAERQILESKKTGLVKNLAISQRDFDELTVRAPFDGVVVAPLIGELTGKYVHKGDEIATVVRMDTLVVRVEVDQAEAGLLFFKEPMLVAFPVLADVRGGLATASGDDVAAALLKDKVEFAEEPPLGRREHWEPIRRITVPQTKLLAGQAGAVVFDFENDRVATVTGTFKSAGAYDALLAEQVKQFGKPEEQPAAGEPDKGAAPGIRPIAAGIFGKRSHWASEHDEAALDVTLTEQKGVAELTYRILGRKVDVRLASNRSANLVGRVMTRVPAASSNLAHPLFTHVGGGEQQNDPHDEKGTRAQSPMFEVRLQLDNPGQKLVPGQRAYVRFTMERDKPLIWQWGRKFWQLVQTQNSQNKWL